MDDLTEVKLMMEGGLADGLWVRHLRMEEGFCRLPRAEIEIVAKKAIAMDDLEGYVEQPAALEISRVDVGSKRRTTRWFSGIVTSVEHEGRILASQGGSVFGYRMTVSPNLVNLAYSQSNLQYADTAALDVVKDILDRYNVAYRLDDRLPDAAKEKHDYFQTEESDYSFLLDVLSACGLSFSYRMPRQEADAKAVKGPMLHIGRGTGLPYASDFAENGNGADPLHSFSCDRERSDATYRRMDHWRMRKSIGTDRVEVGFVDNSGAEAFGAAGAADSLRRMRFNSALSAVSDKGSVDRVTAEYQRALALDTVRWQGRTTCLEAMAGCRLEIHGFFDETGGANDKPIDALVASTVLDCRQALPSDLVGADGENVTHLGIELSCMDGKQVNDDLGDAAVGKRDTLGATGFKGASPNQSKPDLIGKGKPTPVNPPKPVNRLSLVQAVVTNSSGVVDDKNTGNSVELETGYKFTAVPFAGKKEDKITVRLVMPVGGMGQGLFRVPRIGDRILVCRFVVGNVTTYYLQGYLPDANMPFSNTENESTEGATNGKPKLAKNCEMLALRYRNTGTTSVAPNTVRIRRAKDDSKNVCSELAFYNTHEGKMWDPLSDAEKEQFGFEEDLTDAASKVLANFQSTGSMQLSASNRIEMNARNIHIGCPAYKGKGGIWQYVTVDKKKDKKKKRPVNGKLVMDDISELVVRADRRIVLKVRDNQIVIDSNGITISSSRMAALGMMPWQKASIFVGAMHGVDISGADCSMNGFFSSGISDGALAGVKVSSGTVDLSGCLIKQTAGAVGGGYNRGIVYAIENLLVGGISFLMHCLSKSHNDASGGASFFPVGGWFANLAGFIDMGNHRGKNDRRTAVGEFTEHSGRLLAIKILNFIWQTIELVVFAVRQGVGEYGMDVPLNDDKNKDSFGGSWTVMDIIVILSMALKTAAWLVAYEGISLKAKGILNDAEAVLSLSPKFLSINARNVDVFTIQKSGYNSIKAGTNSTFTAKDGGFGEKQALHFVQQAVQQPSKLKRSNSLIL